MKLKGRENYPAWVQQVQYYLREVRVWDIIQGQELALELVDKVDGKVLHKQSSCYTTAKLS
jgi:hypothetical protein